MEQTLGTLNVFVNGGHMLIWLFFIGDLISLFGIIGMHFDFITGWRIPIWCIIYLLAKGLFFLGDILSVLDIIVALYMIIMLVFNVSWFFTYFAIAFLVYKLVMTFMY